MRFSRLLVWVALLAALFLAACEDDEPPPSQPTSTPQEVALATSTPADSIEPAITAPPSTPPTPVPGPSPTATLNFPVWQYASTWALNLRYEITAGGPFLEVDQWIYSGQVVLRVLEDGSASGSGVLYPAPLDTLCTVTPNDSEGYAFTMSGGLRYDGEKVWLDIEMLPTDYFYIENYTVLCPDYNEPRQVANNYLWPMLGQVEALHYTFPLDRNSFNLVHNEDLNARTNGVLRGALHYELLLQR